MMISMDDISKNALIAATGGAEEQFKAGIDYITLYSEREDTEEERIKILLLGEKYSKESAEQGYASAQLCMGEVYYNGHGVSQDYKQAVKWYQKVAGQGHAYAQDKVDELLDE